MITATALLLEAFGRHRDLAAAVHTCRGCGHSLHRVSYRCSTTHERFSPNVAQYGTSPGGKRFAHVACLLCDAHGRTGGAYDPTQPQIHTIGLVICPVCQRAVPEEDA